MFKIVSTPFDFPYDDDSPSDVQSELIELQASDVLLTKLTFSKSVAKIVGGTAYQGR